MRYFFVAESLEVAFRLQSAMKSKRTRSGQTHKDAFDITESNPKRCNHDRSLIQRRAEPSTLLPVKLDRSSILNRDGSSRISKEADQNEHDNEQKSDNAEICGNADEPPLTYWLEDGEECKDHHNSQRS